jgi:tetratricopeptide (TPR) repeat protein
MVNQTSNNDDQIDPKEIENAFLNQISAARAQAEENPTAELSGLITSLLSLGNYYCETKELTKAEETYLEIIGICRTQIEKGNSAISSPHLATSLHRLGLIYQYTQRLTEAEELLQECKTTLLTLAETDLGTYLPELSITFITLGNLYRETKRNNEAEKMYQNALMSYEILIKETENASMYIPSLLETQTYLGNLYQEWKKEDEAITSYEQSLKICRFLIEAASKPNEFQSTLASTLNKLGELYTSTNQYQDAETRLLEALDTYKKLAEDNPVQYFLDELDCQKNLGLLYIVTQRIKEGEEILLNRANVLISFGISQTEHYHIAEDFFKEAMRSVDILRQIPQQKSEASLAAEASILNELALLYSKTHRIREAEETYLSALKVFELLSKNEPANILNSAATYGNLAGC